MLTIDIPGMRLLELEHLVLDLNGTLAQDGEVLDGRRGGGRGACAGAARRGRSQPTPTARPMSCSRPLGLEHVHVIARGREAEAKLDLVDELGGDSVVAIGNGANDALMLRDAALGIAVIGGEGRRGCRSSGGRRRGDQHRGCARAAARAASADRHAAALTVAPQLARLEVLHYLGYGYRSHLTQPRAARSRRDHRRPAARARRRRLGQDARAHLPHRAPRRRPRREPARDPRDHLHQQGRRRDARASRRARRATACARCGC